MRVWGAISGVVAVALVAGAAGSVQADDVWSLADGRTTLRADAAALSAAGVELDVVDSVGVSRMLDGTAAQFPFVTGADVRVVTVNGLVTQIDGEIRHVGGLTLSGASGLYTLDPFTLRFGSTATSSVRLSGVDPGDGSEVFQLGDVSLVIDPVSRTLLMSAGDVWLSPGLVRTLGLERLAGQSIGMLSVEARLAVATNGAVGRPAGFVCPGAAIPPVIGPDVIVGNLSAISNYGSANGISAFSVGTDSCNLGDDCLLWIAGTNEHPVIAQNMYRLKNDRFEQIGMSWLKHAFTALTGNLCEVGCTPPGTGARLGVGCSDPYSASLNGTPSILGPRNQVNAHTGVFTFPRDIPNPSCAGCTAEVIPRRLQVHNVDLDNPGATYFVEGLYVAADDAAWNNGNNNASYRAMFFAQRRCEFNAAITCEIDADCPGVGERCRWPFTCPSFLQPGEFCALVTNTTQREQPAIRAWRDNDFGVVETDVQIPDEGLLILAAKAIDLGTGQWRYEYAIENLNSDRSAGSFSIPLPVGAVVTNTGFHDVDYHSGEPYGTTRCSNCAGNPSVTCGKDSDCSVIGAGACVVNPDLCPAATCAAVCRGGVTDGNTCTTEADCRACNGGVNDGSPCSTAGDCPAPGACVGSCEAFCEKPPCASDADCFGATCDVATGECDNDWPAVVVPGSITWSTTPFAQDPFANALRWSTLYNFRFDANVGPDTTTATIGLFKPGFPDGVSAETIGPALGLIDCNGNSVPDACDISCAAVGCVPPCGGIADCNDNGVPDDCEPDCNGNGRADQCDIDVADGGLCTGPGCSSDCEPNTVPDECEPDCDADGVPDGCDTSEDCDGDGLPDCQDACPCTTPAGACDCSTDGCCVFPLNPTQCISNVFNQATCEASGGTWVCNVATCRNGCLVGDWDGDGDIDMEDDAGFQTCFSGPIGDPGFVAPSEVCLIAFDFDGDGDIDHDDFKQFEAALTGPAPVFNACAGICMGCVDSAECDDGNACTDDVCEASQCVHTPVPNCVACTIDYACNPIDIVFVMDTSGSMLDEAAVLCDKAGQVIGDLEAVGATVNARMLGITETPSGFTCLTDTVASLLCNPGPCTVSSCGFPGGVSSFESWGPATQIVAEKYPWTPGATRIIVPMGDEGPCNGSLPDGCNVDGDDGASIVEAVGVAAANDVIVSPITGTGAGPCVTSLAALLASGTGGGAFQTTTAGADIPPSIVEIVLNTCAAAAGCDDGNICTTNDTCVDGICQGTLIPGCEPCDASGHCSDANACTDDTCVGSECVGTPNFNEATQCCDPATGTTVLLDDGNPCTLDVCDPQSGTVSHPDASDGTTCDDNVFCNGADTCLAGSCSDHAGNPCIGGGKCADSCNETDGTCAVAQGTPCNDDGNPCTDNICDGIGNCTAVPNTALCDDGVFCNGEDTCLNGACTVHAGDPCANGPQCANTCDESSGSCNVAAGTPCADDGNVCTDNTCDGLGQCVAANNVAPCDDAVFCNGADSCAGGICSVHAGDPCAGGGECAGTCDELEGSCFTPAGVACSDDGNPCTDNQCDGLGACVAVNNTVSCDDGNPCTIGDVCDGAGTCFGAPSDDPVCATAEVCLKAVAGVLPGEGCYGSAEEIVVDIVLTHSPVPVIGGQFFVVFDPTKLRILSASPGNTVDPGSPFSLELLEDVDNVNGSMFYAVGVMPGGDPGTRGSSVLATVRFEPLAACSDLGSLCFGSNHHPGNILTDQNGQSVPFTTCCSVPLMTSGDPPTLDCPASVEVTTNPGEIQALVTWDPVTATGGCGGAVELSCMATHSSGLNIDHLIDAGGLFPSGTAEFHCVATDGCGVTSTCDWTVQVNPANAFTVNIELSPRMVPGPLPRCIVFELFSNCVESPVVVEKVLDFGFPLDLPGRATNVSFEIPAGEYTCVAARDQLHTLRAVSDMAIVNDQWVARFTGDPSLGGNWLVGGDLNGDSVIDILDFGAFVATRSDTVSTGSSCRLGGPRADINGDGMVDSLDLAFVSTNYLEADNSSCCPGGAPGARAPITDISLSELDALGLGYLRVADINGDGRLNYDDLLAVQRGAVSVKPGLIRDSSRRR